MNEQATIIVGDARTVLTRVKRRSVHMAVTSPPYFGLRDYDHAQQIGREQTLTRYIASLLEVFGEVYEVLRDDGTLWLNLGDTYQKKQLLGVPWRVAFALQDAGWYLRSEIIWHKPNAMPNPAKDRFGIAHEQLFLFSKKQKYFFDQEAVKELATCKNKRGPAKHADTKSTNGNGGLGRREIHETRNKRSVWTIPVACYRDAHFATFPPKLVEPCILAGTSEHGVCATCGAPWRRLVKKERIATRPGLNTKINKIDAKTIEANGYNQELAVGNRDPQRHITKTTTVGWEAGCGCGHAEREPALVLDPFAGAATTGLVALQHGRRFVGVELNEQYAELARKRLVKQE